MPESSKDVQGRLSEAFTPIGGGSAAVPVMRGMEALISSQEALTKEMNSIARELKTSNEMGRKFYGDRAVNPQQIDDAIKEAVTKATEYTRQQAPPPPSTPPRPRNPREESPASQGHVPRTDQIGDGGPQGAVFGWEQGRNYNLGSLRQDVARRVSKRISEWQPGEQLSQQPPSFNSGGRPVAQGADGRWRVAEGPGAGQFVSQDSVAETPGSWVTQAGEVASAGQVGNFMRNQRVAGAIKGTVGSVAEGKSFGQAALGALPRGAAGALGVAGASYMVAGQLADFAINQRSQNAEWQRMLGGDNREGYGERLRQGMFERQMRFGGVMSGEDAGQLYRGVAATGMNRDERTGAQDFAVSAYKSMGMSVQESVRVIQIASQSGQESLQGVAESLKNVTAAARDAGVNAETAREKFVTNFDAISRTISGSAAAVTAGALSTAQTNLGREYQDMDLTGFNRVNVLRMAGARQGLTLGQTATAMSDPRAGVENARLMQDQVVRQSQGFLGRRGRQIVADFKRNNPLREGQTDYSREQYMELQRLLVADNPNLDPQVIADVMSQMAGVEGLDVSNSIGFLARVETGAFNPAQEAERLREQSQVTPLTDEQRKDIKSRQGDAWKSLAGSITDTPLEEFQALGGAGGLGGGKEGKSRNLYLDSLTKGGQNRSPIIEKMLKEGYDSSRRFKVQTRDGERVVSMDEAIKHYSDQFAKGDIEIVQGQGMGSTVAEAAGLEGADIDVKTDEEKAKSGKKLEDWEKGKDKGGGRVLISPTPELSRLLRFAPSGNVDVSNYAPPDAHAGPGARPTGNLAFPNG